MGDRMTAAQLQAFYKAEGDTSLPRRDLEGPIHRAILDLLALTLPPDAVWHHSPNELDMAGPEAARQIAKARKLGTRAGWPDIEIIWQGRAYFMEVKAESRQSDAQKEVEEDLVRAGACYAVVRSVREAEDALMQWGMI